MPNCFMWKSDWTDRQARAQTGRQTDSMMKITAASRNFVNAPNKNHNYNHKHNRRRRRRRHNNNSTTATTTTTTVLIQCDDYMHAHSLVQITYVRR
jgi:hypothetical protein